jgi:hypothetical protein
MGFLPRAGGIMDQDPVELRIIDLALEVFDEKQKQEDDRQKRQKG